jgi:hypothetical protein
MKKLLILVLAVAAAGVLVAGSATAAKPPKAGSVTISLSQPTVTYGETVTLSGSVGNGQAGEKVTVLAEEFGQTAFASVATVDTTSGGKWTYTATPKIQTAYEAKWTGSLSRTVSAKVRPALMLSKVSLSGARGTFMVKAEASRSFAGKFVLVQRLSSSGARVVKKVVLGGDSAATFTIRVQRGVSRLRAVMPTSQTQPGYVAAQSLVLVVRR